MNGLPRLKVWRYPRVLTEHIFDKLWLLDLTLAEFRGLLDADAEVIEASPAEGSGVKEILLFVDLRLALHVVVVVDDAHHEERLITVYEPSTARWSDDYRSRR